MHGLFSDCEDVLPKSLLMPNRLHDDLRQKIQLNLENQFRLQGTVVRHTSCRQSWGSTAKHTKSHGTARDFNTPN
jgi:hypothetical protein